MRTILSLLCFSLIPATALAQPSPDPVATCANVGAVPLDTRSDTPVISARLSMASCGAQARMSALTITDDDAGVAVVQAALEPSLATFDDIAKNDDDPRWQILSAQARADLRFAAVTRLRAAIPPINATATGDELMREDADRAARRDALEPKVLPWIQAATADCQRVIAIAQQYPQVLDDLTVASAVRRAQDDLAAQGWGMR